MIVSVMGEQTLSPASAFDVLAPGLSASQRRILGFMASAESGRDRPRLHLCNCPMSDLVEVSTVPCRAELGFIRELLGESLTRMAYIPSGDASCSYRTRAG